MFTHPHMRTAIARAIFLLSGLTTGQSLLAQTATFNEATNQLTLPSVTVGSVVYSNVVIRLGSFSVLSVGSATAAGTGSTGGTSTTLTESCPTFTAAKFNAIVPGMSVDQVNQTLGCKFRSD